MPLFYRRSTCTAQTGRVQFCGKQKPTLSFYIVLFFINLISHHLSILEAELLALQVQPADPLHATPQQVPQLQRIWIFRVFALTNQNHRPIKYFLQNFYIFWWSPGREIWSTIINSVQLGSISPPNRALGGGEREKRRSSFNKVALDGGVFFFFQVLLKFTWILVYTCFCLEVRGSVWSILALKENGICIYNFVTSVWEAKRKRSYRDGYYQFVSL